MAKRIQLTAKDGHKLDALRSDARGRSKGAMVIVHFVFGLTDHIGEICDDFAAHGYDVVAPCIFDRVGKNLTFPYTDEGAQAGYQIYLKIKDHHDDILTDIDAAVTTLKPSGRIAVSGFCLGGTWAWAAAAKLQVDAAIGIYGSYIAGHLEYAPRVPVQLHYGDCDPVVPLADIEKIRKAYPKTEIHIYPGAAHSFYNPNLERHNPGAAALVRERWLDFMEKHIAAK